MVSNIWIIFHFIYGIILPIDFHIFQKGWNHQPVGHAPKVESLDLKIGCFDFTMFWNYQKKTCQIIDGEIETFASQWLNVYVTK